MKRLGVVFGLLLAPALLAACSHRLQATLFNSTAEAVEARVALERTIIAPNRFSQINYPGYSTNQVFRLFSGGCEYLYDVPPDVDNYRVDLNLDRGIQIQVEADFSIDLLPPSFAGDAPASGAMILQHEGFPLHPVSRKCR